MRAESVDAVVTIVGRERELAALSELLEAAGRGRGSIAVLVGEPGIGKTATAREFARRADDNGVLVHWAACFEDDPTPFASWVRIASRIVECAESDDLRRRLGSAAAAAAAVVPALAEKLSGLAPPAPLAPAEARFRASDALARLAGAAGLTGTTVMVVDDLQWADSSSLEFLPHVARALRDEPVLLLGTAREPEVGLDHPLAHALAAAERELPVHRIPVAALDRSAIADLIAGSAGREASPEAVEAVLRETGGNAFFAHELVRHLLEEGYDLVNREVPAEAVPAGVRDAVGGRIRRLSVDARSALAVACAFAGPFGFDELEAVTGLTEESLLAVLDELLAASMLRAVEADRYEFGHSIVRHTLYEALTPSRRARLHRRVVEALETVEGGAAGHRSAELAEQYHRSRSLPGAANGVPHALAAAEAARRSFAYGSAARSLRIARELAADAPATVGADILRRLAVAEAEALHVDEARAAAEDALRELEAARASGEEIAAFLVEAAWALQDAGAEDVLVRPLVARGLALLGDDRGLVWARLKLAERPLERFVVAGVKAGRWTGFDPRAIEIARSRGSERDWAKTLELMDWRSRDETDAVASAALEWQDRGAAIHALSVVTRSLMHQHGAFREAAQSAADLRTLSEHVGSLPGQAYAHVYLSWSALVAGDLELARDEAARADDAVARLGRGHRLHFTLRFLRCAILEGVEADWARAAELRMETVRERAFPPWMTLLYLSLAARAYAVAGDEPPARRLLDEIVPVLTRLPATTLNQNGAVAAAAWASWLLRSREHAPTLRRSALALIEAGVGDYPTTSRELAVAWTTGLAGDSAEELEYLERARAVLSAAGQLPLLELVESTRAGAGRPDGLTGREVEVLRALAAGRSNKEIAAELVLSVHTVERHVANAYRKIGAHNRAEATAYAVTAGL